MASHFGSALRRNEYLILVSLGALACVTRWPLAGLTWGESDGARFLIGLHQWLAHGPAAAMVYSKTLSPGYYAFAAALVHRFALTPASVLNGISVVAAIVTAPLLYLFGCRLTRPSVAGLGAALFLLSPGFWWLGIEPHPQGLSFLFFIAGALALFRPTPWRWLAGTALLAAALLINADILVLILALPAISHKAWQRTTVAAGAAFAAFLLLRAWLLHTPLAAVEAKTDGTIAAFLRLPHGADWVRQLLPFVTAPGLATLALTLVGLYWGLRQPVWRRRWSAMLAWWVVPGVVTWTLIHGNNARHVVELLLLPLWAGLEAWSFRYRTSAVAAICCAVVLLNLPLPRPSSNMTLYPSANVFASQRDLAARMQDLARWQLDTPSPGVCYLGNYTLPYLELNQWRTSGSFNPGPYIEVNSPAEYLAAANACAQPRSLEYDPDGVHRQFLGEEWRGIPLRRHWYPAYGSRSSVATR